MRRTLTASLTAALKDVTLQDKDAAAVRLAQEYASRLDDGEDAVRLGPAYLAVLTSLGMTPAGRAAITGKGASASGSGPNPLDELRQRRAARAN